MSSGRRSVWGWGHQEKFPSREERKEILDLVQGFLDFEGLDVQDPTPIEEVSLPEAQGSIPDALEPITRTSKRERMLHTYGRAYRDLIRGFRGEYEHPPDVVAYPRNEEDVTDVLEWADRQDHIVIPFGGGTSVVGGIEADPEWARKNVVISLDTRKLDRVLDVDTTSNTARIQAGATGPVLQEQLREHDRCLRHYPQSYEFSTLGGWIATRASGHYATLQTRIDDFVESVRMVTPSGTVQTRRLPSTGAGPDPEGMILGSEGTLGVITEASLQIQEEPEYRAKASVTFEDFEDAVETTRTLAQTRLFPTNLRLLDAREAFLNQIVENPTNVLLLGFEDSQVPNTSDDLEHGLDICRQRGGTVLSQSKSTPESREDDKDESGEWRQSFLEGPYLYNVLVSLGVIVDTFETALPWDRFYEAHHAIKTKVQAALEDACGDGAVTCRFTHVYPDGVAPYYTFLGPARRGNELKQWKQIKTVASDAVVDHGGTITHHHAVGRVHKPWFKQERDTLILESLKAVKQKLDPNELLNPGVLF